jgi:Flp pilus assembly protein CpaB
LRRRRPSLRRWLAAGCAAAGVAAGLGVVAPTPPAVRTVLVAAHDLPAGGALQAGDLSPVRRPSSDLPASAVQTAAAAVGQVLATPLQAGELLTTSRLVGPGLLSGRPTGDVAAPVRVADGAASALLRPGSRVDVLVTVADAASARTVARGATVLAVPSGSGAGGESSGGSGGGSGGGLLGGGPTDPAQGGLLLLAVPASTATELAQAAATGPLSFLIR